MNGSESMNENVRCACGHPDLSASTNRQFHLVRIPDGPRTRDCFKLAIAAIPEPKDGGITLHLSEVKGPIMDRLKRSHFLEELTGKDHLTQYDAVASIKPELARRTLEARRVP